VLVNASSVALMHRLAAIRPQPPIRSKVPPEGEGWVDSTIGVASVIRRRSLEAPPWMSP